MLHYPNMYQINALDNDISDSNFKTIILTPYLAHRIHLSHSYIEMCYLLRLYLKFRSSGSGLVKSTLQIYYTITVLQTSVTS